MAAGAPTGAPTAAAASAPATSGRIVLTISGDISSGGSTRSLDLDMAALAALPQHSFTTRTPWYPQPVQFTGPLLRDVLALAGARGEQLTAVALNDYKVDLPTADTKRWNVVIARLQDGKPMSVRQKGPLFIVYPFDASEELRSERYYGRSAWQLRRLVVK
ncbi:MAG: hypothetical protein H6933_06615 [Burkholderiaceae bacterium]|nr:hypothetical protein [Burkholderiaceae bacterium]